MRAFAEALTRVKAYVGVKRTDGEVDGVNAREEASEGLDELGEQPVKGLPDSHAESTSS